MDSENLSITPLPAFDDNYIWLLRHATEKEVAVVDPGDPEVVIEALRQQNLKLSAVLITHHHWDHAGGIEELKLAYPACCVYGPEDKRIPNIDYTVSEGSEVVLAALQASFRVLETPGHTASHIAYYGEGVLFCGDTLFAGGCGRVFDGTFDQLAHSLQRIATLPQDTLCYCAHEYTMANLGFARWVEPDNPALLKREADERKRLDAGQPTVPSLLQLELQTNPFLRTQQPSVIKAAQRVTGATLGNPADVFRALRQWKDREYD